MAIKGNYTKSDMSSQHKQRYPVWGELLNLDCHRTATWPPYHSFSDTPQTNVLNGTTAIQQFLQSNTSTNVLNSLTSTVALCNPIFVLTNMLLFISCISKNLESNQVMRVLETIWNWYFFGILGVCLDVGYCSCVSIYNNF